MKVFTFILLLSVYQVSYSQSSYLISGTYTNAEKSKGIYIYEFNSAAGTAKFISSIYTDNPSYLALDKNSSHVYAVNEVGDGKGAVSSFSFDKKNGSLHLINRQLTNEDDPCYISIDSSNKWAAVANYSGGSFSLFPIMADGSLGASVQTIRHSGSGPNRDRQEKPHVHSTVFSPGNHFLAVTDLGTDKISIYPFNASKEKPVTEQAVEINTSPGSGPRHILFNPSKPYAYLIEELSGNVTVYGYTEGKLDSIQSISAHPAGFKGEKGSAAVHFSPDGKYLYASNRGESNTISIFSIDNLSGKLTSIGFQSTGGDHPRDFTIDPSGKFLLVGNMKSGYISIFARNPHSGLLKDTRRKINITEPTHLLFTRIR